MTQRDLWRHSATDEAAAVELHPGVARLYRSGTVTERRHPPDWEQQARQAAEKSLEAMQQFEGIHHEFMALDDGSKTEQLQTFGGKFFRKESRSSPGRYVRQPEHSRYTHRTPQDGTLLSSLITELQDARFVRQTTRQPNGSLLLPSELEPWREQLQASERGVARLTGDASRRPALWENKLAAYRTTRWVLPGPSQKKTFAHWCSWRSLISRS